MFKITKHIDKSGKCKSRRIAVSYLALLCLFNNLVVANASATTKETYSESALLNEANKAFWAKDITLARNKLGQINCQAKEISQARLAINLAVCDADLDLWDQAAKESSAGIALAEKDSMDEADGLLVLARCFIVEKKIKKAKETYEQALAIARKKLGDWNPDLAPYYEGLGACEIYDKQLAKAVELYKKVAQLDYLKYGPDDTYIAWSLITLSSLFQELGKPELARTLYKKVFWNFRHQNEERILSEIKPTESEREAVVAELRKQLYGLKNAYGNRQLGLDYIEDGIPPEVLKKSVVRPQNINNWFPERAGRERAPGLAFFDPKTKLKALVITIPGLGLHQGAYTPFAKKVQHEGLGIISFDVRGFGSYRNDEIYQQINFKAIIHDLQKLLRAIKEDYPGIPIYVLGESMGGAIALRLAALSPDLVSGVVSSVPSASRFQAKSTAVKVALRFFKNSHKQFNIGQSVVDQATKDLSLRVAWEDDPKARMNFSASELLEFQNFMNDNVKFAEQIKNTPVIIFQGYSDQLVKPLGTLALYQAISAKDKDLVFVGHAEHLIFEEGQFDQDIVDGVVSWIKKHASRLELKD